jgi:hypothetical protein
LVVPTARVGLSLRSNCLVSRSSASISRKTRGLVLELVGVRVVEGGTLGVGVTSCLSLELLSRLLGPVLSRILALGMGLRNGGLLIGGDRGTLRSGRLRTLGICFVAGMAGFGARSCLAGLVAVVAFVVVVDGCFVGGSSALRKSLGSLLFCQLVRSGLSHTHAVAAVVEGVAGLEGAVGKLVAGVDYGGVVIAVVVVEVVELESLELGCSLGNAVGVGLVVAADVLVAVVGTGFAEQVGLTVVSVVFVAVVEGLLGPGTIVVVAVEAEVVVEPIVVEVVAAAVGLECFGLVVGRIEAPVGIEGIVSELLVEQVDWHLSLDCKEQQVHSIWIELHSPFHMEAALPLAC